MRRFLAGASLLLVAGMTAACGGAPDDASEKDFCETMEGAPTEDKPSQDDLDDWVDELEDTGTPEDIPDDARKGFETFVDVVGDLDMDDSEKEIEEELDDEVKGDDEDDVNAFLEYYAKTCSPAEG